MRRRAKALEVRGIAVADSVRPRKLAYKFKTTSPRILLLGTALASTFLLGTLTAPTPAMAVVDSCDLPGTDAVRIPAAGNSPVAVTCVNTETRIGEQYGGTGDYSAIGLYTDGAGATISVTNTGDLTTGPASDFAFGLLAYSNDDDSDIAIFNDASIVVTATGNNIASGIDAETDGLRSSITVTNHGDVLVGSDGGYARGIRADGGFEGAPVTVTNYGDLTISADEDSATGIFGYGVVGDGTAPVKITNHGDMTIRAQDYARGIGGEGNEPVTIVNTGTLNVRSTGNGAMDDAFGIDVETNSYGADISITNRGELIVAAERNATGINTRSGGGTDTTIVNYGPMTVTSARQDARGINAVLRLGNPGKATIENHGRLTVTATQGSAYGIRGVARDYRPNNTISVTNAGKLTIAGEQRSFGIFGETQRENSPITITNSGAIEVETTGAYDASVRGISAEASERNSRIEITNSGTLRVTSVGENGQADGIYARTNAASSPVSVTNSGNIWATTAGLDADAHGIRVRTAQYDEPIPNSPIEIRNSGNIWASTSGRAAAFGILGDSGGQARVLIDNSGNVRAMTIGEFAGAYGIQALSEKEGSPLTVRNSGDVYAYAADRTSVTYNGITYGTRAFGIVAVSEGGNNPISIENSGSVYAKGGFFSVGVYANSGDANKTTITNTGEIGAESHLAIDVNGAGTANIFNAGTITGFVDLTAQNDRFFNQAGGVFETKMISFFGRGDDVFRNAGRVDMGDGSKLNFGDGDDLFTNRSGGIVQIGSVPSKRERGSFRGLETFKNTGGTISLVDGGIGDKFTIANEPGEANLKFEGGGFLAVDAELGGPGSKADNFIVDGNVSGQTKVVVNDIGPAVGVLNTEDIKVVFVEGNTPNENNFVLANGPIDKGFFSYDLFFTPTGSGFWSFKSFVDGSAYTLPKLLTAAQDIWHQSSATWFDRTADLRVVLNQGGAGGFETTNAGLGASHNGLSPGAWIKGGGAWLEREDSATTTAFGRSYDFDLDGELQSVDLQVGLDGGAYNVLSDGDALIVGVLGGFVGGNLDFDALADQYNFSGGQVGAYATYLNDGLFVDTLVNVHLYEIDTPNLGFPNSLDATTVGVRTDAGYRFGSFTGGAFFEPLATIAVTWADIDGFNVGGNKVSFSDDANVRGRLGARVGTTMNVWEGTTLEPFLIASLWSNLSDENSATLVSSGRTFQFQDDLQDVWGEVSAGANLFNFNETTSVFAKADVTFGEDISGISGKGGVRVSW